MITEYIAIEAIPAPNMYKQKPVDKYIDKTRKERKLK